MCRRVRVRKAKGRSIGSGGSDGDMAGGRPITGGRRSYWVLGDVINGGLQRWRDAEGGKKGDGDRGQERRE